MRKTPFKVFEEIQIDKNNLTKTERGYFKHLKGKGSGLEIAQYQCGFHV